MVCLFVIAGAVVAVAAATTADLAVAEAAVIVAAVESHLVWLQQSPHLLL
jgi:hypothetical protein